MIIGIDETGDFSPKSEKLSFFIAALLDQSENGLEKKRKQFSDWSKTIPIEKINEKGEVKGSELDEIMLQSFVDNVYNQEPQVRVSISCFNPKENPEDIMQKFKEIEVDILLNEAKSFRENGNEKKAKRIERMAYWYKNRTSMNYNHYFKLMLLKSIINNSFISAIGASIIIEFLKQDKESTNLLNLEFKIDKDFISGDEAISNWKKLLERSFQQFNKKNPIPILEDWKSNDHPFIKKFKSSDSETLNFKEIFNKSCNFGHSHENFEIQIADIIGIIINRHENDKKIENVFNSLWLKIQRPNFQKIILQL